MKFLCDHCKAKYQIADDKVAGRTVRMKCRKCGNQIEVRAAVTETSVSTHAPQDAGAAAQAPAAHPKPAIQKPPPPRSGLATPLSAARPPTHAAAPRAPTPAPKAHDALAGAFQRSVQKEEEISVALDLRELSAADEWYVAINGVPVGPVRVAELRRKAALGVVTEDSLVWQEGMEEWRPVRAVTELAAVVREAAAGGRVSLVTPPPPEARGSQAPAAPRPGSQRPAGPPYREPMPRAPTAPHKAPASPPATARSNVVPINSRLATAERLEVDEDATVAEPAPVSAALAPMAHPDPFAFPPPQMPAAAAPSAMSGPLAPSISSPVFPTPLGAEQRKSPPWLIIAMLVLAAAFGVTAAIVMFKPTPQVVVTVPTAAVAPPPTTPDTPTATTPTTASTDTVAATAPEGGAPKSGVASRGGGGGGRATSSGGAATDPDLQNLIRGQTGGPSAGPGGGGGGGGGTALSENQVRNVVNSHAPGIKRTCWERSSSQAASANIDVKISVGATGSVQNAEATGNDPVIAKCIENAVRGWIFPPSDGPSTITVPFHFVHQ